MNVVSVLCCCEECFLLVSAYLEVTDTVGREGDVDEIGDVVEGSFGGVGEVGGVGAVGEEGGGTEGDLGDEEKQE